MKEKLHLLVPTAGTPHCQSAVLMGVHLAKRHGGMLTVLSVVRRKSQGSEGESILNNAVRLAESEGITPKTTLRVGSIEREILREAVETQADLIVMGSRPWHNRLRSLLGSVSKHVIEKAPCPVLVARGEARLPANILVCDSGAAEPRLVPRLIQALPFLLHAEVRVTVLHVMSQMSAGPGVKGWELRADADMLVKAHTPEGEILETDVELLIQTGGKPRFLVRHGLVVEEIMAEAEDGGYDLVVIGAHQHGGWQDLLLDDLQQQIIACLSRPVLVVR